MTQRSWWSSAVILACAAAMVTSVARHSAAQARDPLFLVWHKKVRRVQSMAISATGSRLATIDNQGRIRLFDALGNVIWSASTGGADRVAVSADGHLVAAYAARQPLLPEAQLYSGEGRPLGVLQAAGAITTLAVSSDGRQIAIGTRAGVNWWRRDGSKPEAEWRQTLVQAAETSQVQFGPRNSLYVASRGADGVRRLDSRGQPVWQARDLQAMDATISATPQGYLLAYASPSSGSSGTFTVQVRNAGGQLIWEMILPGRAPCVRAVPDGTAVVVSYEKAETHGSSIRHERRLAYFPLTTPGAQGWTKGGAFTAPLFAAAAPDGSYVVSLDVDRRVGSTNLRLLNREGFRRWIYETRNPVSIATASQDGSRIATYHSDGRLEVIGVAPE